MKWTMIALCLVAPLGVRADVMHLSVPSRPLLKVSSDGVIHVSPSATVESLARGIVEINSIKAGVIVKRDCADCR